MKTPKVRKSLKIGASAVILMLAVLIHSSSPRQTSVKPEPVVSAVMEPAVASTQNHYIPPLVSLEIKQETVEENEGLAPETWEAFKRHGLDKGGFVRLNPEAKSFPPVMAVNSN